MQEILGFSLFVFVMLVLIMITLWLVDKITDVIIYKKYKK